MTIKGKLNQEEFDRRCREVFFTQEGDNYYSIEVVNGEVLLNMEELDWSGQTVIFDYRPDMSERPEALDYLLGNRDDFND